MFEINHQTEHITSNEVIQAEANAITFTNLGASTMFIFDRPILPNQSAFFECGHPEGIDMTNYEIKFENGKGKCEILTRKVKNLKKNCKCL